jgi:tRNA G18 (ribose-2'-O)-methylase SpoU
MPIIEVADAADPRLALYRNVPDAALLKDEGLFVAEGRLVVQRLLGDVRLTPRSLMVTRTALEAIGNPAATHPGLPVYVVPQDVMNGVTGFNLHRGCLALAERPPARDWRDLVVQGGPDGPLLLVVLEQVGNADNVGSIVRSAAALGAGAVLLGPGCADPLYRKAIRTSMGAALRLPFAEATPWPECLDQLNHLGIATIGLTPAASAAPVADVAAAVAAESARRLRNAGPARRVAILLGHEGDGLSAEALARCTHQARIPISGAVDSLNVAVAAAIALSAFAAFAEASAPRGTSGLRSPD